MVNILWPFFHKCSEYRKKIQEKVLGSNQGFTGSTDLHWGKKEKVYV